jgi:hypothetical protein
MQYITKGMFVMVVDANTVVEAKQTAERILKHEGVKAVAVEATENEPKSRGGTRS